MKWNHRTSCSDTLGMNKDFSDLRGWLQNFEPHSENVWHLHHFGQNSSGFCRKNPCARFSVVKASRVIDIYWCVQLWKNTQNIKNRICFLLEQINLRTCAWHSWRFPSEILQPQMTKRITIAHWKCPFLSSSSHNMSIIRGIRNILKTEKRFSDIDWMLIDCLLNVKFFVLCSSVFDMTVSFFIFHFWISCFAFHPLRRKKKLNTKRTQPKTGGSRFIWMCLIRNWGLSELFSKSHWTTCSNWFFLGITFSNEAGDTCICIHVLE